MEFLQMSAFYFSRKNLKCVNYAKQPCKPSSYKLKIQYDEMKRKKLGYTIALEKKNVRAVHKQPFQ